MRRCIGRAVAAFSLLAAAASGYTIEQYLNIRGNWGGAWLPGGAFIFQNKAAGVNQVWRAAGPGAAPDQLTSFPEGVDFAFAHAVTGRVVVGVDVHNDERTQLYLLERDGAAPRPLTENPKAIYEFGDWSRDGRLLAYASNERDERYFDVYVLDLASGERRLLMRQDGNNAAAAFSPDASKLLVYRAHGSQDCDLYLVDVATGAAELLTPHEGELNVGAVAWDGAGAGFYFTSDEGRDFLALAYYDLAAKSYDWRETPPWDVDECVTSWTGRYLLWTTNEDGFSVVHVRDLESGLELAPPALPGRGVANGFRFAPDDAAVLFNFSSPVHPTDVYRWGLGEEAATAVTQADLAGVPASSFVDCRLVDYVSFDGTMVPAYEYVPPGAGDDRATPVVFHAHGGPQGQQRPYFDPLYQYWLDAGYAVFVPNFRGSTGYGQTYADADNLDRREDAVLDVFYGWRYLAEQEWCDPLKIAIYGSSYGGYLVLASLVGEPYRWAAGVDICGIANFVTYLEDTGPWRVALREDEYGSLARDRAFLEAISPVHRIHRLRAPLMVIHGAHDPRVPVGEAEQVVAKARQVLGADRVVYLRYEDEGHGLSKRANQLDAYPRMMTFLADAFAARDAQREEMRKEFEREVKAEGNTKPPGDEGAPGGP